MLLSHSGEVADGPAWALTSGSAIRSGSAVRPRFGGPALLRGHIRSPGHIGLSKFLGLEVDCQGHRYRWRRYQVDKVECFGGGSEVSLCFL
jgi:hypothetical protein